jgi:hypothetical protein
MKALYMHCMEQDLGPNRLAASAAAGVHQP